MAQKVPPHAAVKSGNGWLIAIAAFTALNTVLFLLEMDVRMLIGLVWPLVFLYQTGGSGLAIGAAFALAAAFGVLAYLTSRGQRWGLLVATVLYVLDTIVALVYVDFLGLLWHALALFFLVRGIIGLQQLGKAPAMMPGYAPAMPGIAPMPVQAEPELPGAAWLPDPSGRHEMRYWNAREWTDNVSDAGVVATDPLTQTS